MSSIDNHAATTRNQCFKTLPGCQDPVTPSSPVSLTIDVAPMLKSPHGYPERFGQLLGLLARTTLTIHSHGLWLEKSKPANGIQSTPSFKNGLGSVKGLKLRQSGGYGKVHAGGWD